MLPNSRFFFLLLFSCFCLGCTSPEKLLETGQYDQAFRAALNKLAGKKKKAEWVAVLEEAFARATERDMLEAERLKREGNPARLPEVTTLYESIAQRQQALRPLLPLRDENGRIAQFDLVEIDALLRESRRDAAEYLYTRAQRHLDAAAQGNKEEARQAYRLLLQTRDMIPGTFRDRDRLIDDAIYLGTTRIFAEFDLRAPVILPATFADDLYAFYLEGWNDEWTQFYLYPMEDAEMDAKFILRINQAQISPERLQERERNFSRQIEEGKKDMLDDDGNIVRDTLGRPIQVPNLVTVTARMLQTFQNKAARMQVETEWVDLHSGRIVDRQRRNAEAVFENVFARCRGDERAIDSDLRYLCRQDFRPFPPDATMLFDAAASLRPEIQGWLRTVMGGRW